MKKITLLLGLLLTTVAFAQGQGLNKNSQGFTTVINEIDADTEGTDTLEFIEILSDENQSLNGYTVILFNGSNDSAYNIVSLDGLTTDGDGFLILGSDMIAGADVVLGMSNLIQNGADAVGIYLIDAASVPDGVAIDDPILANALVDGVVYGTNDGDDAELLAVYGGTQWDEAQNGNKDFESIQRRPDGTFCTALSTPRADNVCPDCQFVLTDFTFTCDAETEGDDTVSFTVDFIGGNNGEEYLVDASQGTVGGDSPSISETGTITVTGVLEGTELAINVTSSTCDVNQDFTAPVCAPAAVINTIAELRAQTVGGEYVLAGDAFITFTQDFRNQKFIQDPTAAILIDDAPGVILGQFQEGDAITGLTGILNEFQGLLQFQPTEDPGAATSTGNFIEPEQTTVAAIVANPEDFESALVDVEVQNFDVMGTTEWAVGTEYPFEGLDGTPFVFRTSFFDVDYIGMPFTSFTNITGIITERDNGSYFITARSMDDIRLLNVAENNIEGFTMFPNPATNELNFATIAGTSMNVAIYDVTGKQVITTTVNNAALNISNLTAGLYIVKATQDGATTIAKLVVK